MKIPEFGTLQMNRTHPAHVGTSEIKNVNKVPLNDINVQSQQTSKVTVEDYLLEFWESKWFKNYNFEIADIIKENILEMCYNDKGGIYENYDSVTGKGLCCNHFSWSSVFLMEFILNF